MYCPNCNKVFNGKFCPECGTKLIDMPASQGGLSVNLGDGNAISGGIHHQDSHAVTNVDNSLHNITTNSSTVNNITNVASQKTEMEFLQEKKTLYLNACKRAYEDNVLELAEVNALEEERLKLGLDKATADRILNQVRLMSERNARKSELNPIAKVKLRKLTENLQKNEVKALMQQIDSLEPLVNKYDHDELQRKYYLVLAALKSEKCIASYENTQTDNYWNTFWSYLAYIKDGNIVEAENLLESLDRFTSYPEDNMTVLAAAGALMTGRTKEAREYLNAAKGEYTPALQRFVDSLNLLLVPQKAKKTGADENTCAFYLVNFFGQKDPKVKAEEERLKREAAEAERRRKEIEEQKRKEEEARKKTEEEWRKKKAEAAERRRIEAEKKKLEEERKKAEAIEKRKATIEAKKKAEAERLNKIREERLKKEAEEADRKTKEEAIRKAKEAEEAKRRAEEEARRNAEEAERKRLEAERKAKEEAIRKAKEAEEAKRRAEALMLKLQEEKKEKNRKTILFALCVILSIIPLVWVSIGLWEAMGWGSIVIGAIVAAPVGVGTVGIIFGDEKQWKAILFRSVFALIALGLMIWFIIPGTFGFSSICFSFFSGLWCTGFVMAFSKPSFFE